MFVAESRVVLAIADSIQLVESLKLPVKNGTCSSRVSPTENRDPRELVMSMVPGPKGDSLPPTVRMPAVERTEADFVQSSS